MTLDCLQEHGLAANDIQKLNDAGYHTVESVAHATARKLSDVKGISEAKVLKIKEIVKALVPMDFKTAADALEDRKYVFDVIPCCEILPSLVCVIAHKTHHPSYHTINTQGPRYSYYWIYRTRQTLGRWSRDWLHH